MPVTPPTSDDVRFFSSADEFRAWLDEHHGTAAHLWVGYYKKGVPKVAMTYVQAVEEALCFGWIDGITYRMDAEVTATRFTPRRRTSGWSASNIARVAELTAAGRMRPAGLRAFEERDRRKDAGYSYENAATELPDEWIRRLKANPAAWDHWQGEPPSYRRTATYWVMSAKRPETRTRRFGTLLAEAAAGRRPRPFLVERSARNAARDVHQ
jgi:uncharacterized protein YdeI (YjbR/CyaY-like superfamily)